LQRLLNDARGRGIVLAGPAGVGKTRLALELLRLADKSKLKVAQVRATRAISALPFGALAPLLPSMRDDGDEGLADPVALLRRSAAKLAETVAGRRKVLFIDDAHLLDDGSAALIHQVAATGTATVLVTIRTDEPAPEPVLALWKDGLAERVDLGGLDADDVTELLTSALGGQIDEGVVARLVDRCEGNALFLHELVLGAIQDGTLRKDMGIWHLTGPLTPSARLVELVEARLSGLHPDERMLLECVALSEPTGRAELIALSDMAVAERLEQKRLITSGLDDRRLQVTLAHPVYGDILRARMLVFQRQTIARRLAEVLEGTGLRRREDVLRVATWRLEVGGGDPELMLAAALTARWHYDFPLAERLARAAVHEGAGFKAVLLSAQLASLQGRTDEAEREFEALASQAADDAERALVAITRLDNYAFMWGRADESLRVVEQVQIADTALRDEIAARRAGVLVGTEGPRAAAAAVEPLLTRAGGRALVWACVVASHSFGRLGRLDDAVEAARRGHTEHLALDGALEWYPWFSLTFQCQALTYAGRLHEAEELARGYYERGIAERSDEAQAFFAWQLAHTSLAKGHVRTAARYGREAVTLLHQLGRPQLMGSCLPNLTTALALANEPDEANAALAMFDASGISTRFYMGIDSLQALAWVAVAEGDQRKARRLLEEAATQGEEIGDLVGAAAALHDLARLGYASSVIVRLEALAAELDGPLAAARVAHVQSLARHEPEGLVAASVAFEELGADLLAADAAADSAVAWRRNDESRRAAAAERRMGELTDRCEGASTPSLRTVTVRAHLTPAEQETALLASSGQTNKEIAAELCLSVRTVETYLQRAYGKLGISGRSQLDSVLNNRQPI
jgi:DNA-binding CsgD family transcriptional regulator